MIIRRAVLVSVLLAGCNSAPPAQSTEQPATPAASSAEPGTKGMGVSDEEMRELLGVLDGAEETRTVTAEALAEAYRSNATAADSEYLNHPVQVDGVIQAVGGTGGEAYVTLGTGQVRAVFGNEHRGEVASLKVGQHVAIRGVVRGKSADGVMLRDASLATH